MRDPHGDFGAGQVWIEGGTFLMGSDRHYPEEAPVRSVRVEGFWMDRGPVTNAQFARFISTTGYVTVAERVPDAALYPGAQPCSLVPGSLTFRAPSHAVSRDNPYQWWTFTPGACWHQPYGLNSSIEGLHDHPVVQVAFEDAKAYAAWSGQELPTEAEWEYAARGGLERAIYAWGNDLTPEGHFMANTWQGEFPWQNTALDGYERTSPVGSFPANGYGLVDMAGNVWEWTADWYAEQPRVGSKACCTIANPRGPAEAASLDPAQPDIRIPRKVVKGGSFLCAPSYCDRYRPSARQPQMIDTASCHIGFRCISHHSTRARQIAPAP
jgi:formylglycine-generating enzyme required for sulfatase activity